MNRYIIKQLIKHRKDNSIFGYELLFESNDDSLYNSDMSAADAVVNFLLQNNKAIFDGRRTFITLTPTLLFRNTPKMFNKDQVVIQIGESVIVHPLSESFIKRYRSNGFSFAIDDFKFSPKFFSLLENVDYIKINPSSFEGERKIESINNIIEMAHGFGKQVIASNIQTKDDFETIKDLDFDLIQGSYVGQNIKKKEQSVDYLQSNFFRLVVAISRDEPDIDEIEEIISRDAGLSYAILRLANSVNFGLRHKTSSIRQSIVTIGMRQLKQWVYLLTFIDDNGQIDPSSEELLKLSFLRASFAEGLQRFMPSFELTGPECYIMGMFSTLNYLMNAPIEELVSQISIDDTIAKALISEEGQSGKLLKLIKAYEQGSWKLVKQLSAELELPSSIIAQCYMNCVEEVNEIWKSLTSMENDDEVKVDDNKDKHEKIDNDLDFDISAMEKELEEKIEQGKKLSKEIEQLEADDTPPKRGRKKKADEDAVEEAPKKRGRKKKE